MTARTWWMRSPNRNNANNVRNVNTTGAGNNNNADNSTGVAVDCETCQLKVAIRPNRYAHAGSGCPTSKEGIKRVTQAAYEPVLLSAPAILVMDYYNKAISFDALYKALPKVCRNVRWKDSVAGYENNALKNTLALHETLTNGTYKISKYQVFTIHEPKERRIVASRLPDRQVQRALCDAGLYKDITEHFIRDNVACQRGRGTDDALRRMKAHLRRYYNKCGADGWTLKCDVHHFFQSTQHDAAKTAVRKYVSDTRAADMVCNIIDSFDDGIGLGSEISQLVELLVLNDLDHFIKERLHIKHYVRYMDDFILIHPDKDYLRYCRKAIADYLVAIGLTLNRKTNITPLKQGVKYLQWRFVLTDTGKVLMLLGGSKFARQRRRMRKLWTMECRGEVAQGATRESLQAFLAHAARGNTYRQCRRIKQYYKNLTGRCFE